MRNVYPISTYNSNSPSRQIRLRIATIVNLLFISQAASPKRNNIIRWRTLFSLLLLVSLTLNLEAQSIFSNSITGTNPSSTNPYTTGQTVNANIAASGIERGPGNSAFTINNAYGAAGFQSAALSQAKYFQFTITPGSCKEIDFTSFVYTSSISSGTASFAFRSSVDNYANNIGTASSSGTTISLTAAAYQNITTTIIFRMYVWNASSNSIGISINDFTFNGTIGSALPVITTQPTSSATYCQNTSPAALTIAASAGSGTISAYQWYSNTSNSNTNGTAISGANWLSYYPSGATAGTRYYYCSVTNSVGCVATSNIATVNITPQPSGNFAYSNYGFCNSLTSAQTISTSNLIGTGTYSAASGLTINATTGAITPSTSTPSTTPYVVTYTVPASGGCSAYSSTTNVTIDAKGTGSISYPTTGLCSSSNAPVSPVITGASGSGNSTWVLGAPSGLAMNGSGVITPSSSTPGNYTITYYRSASGACPEYSTTTSISIGGGFTANAGSDFTKTCTNYTNGHHIGFYDGDSDGQNDEDDDNDGDGNSDNENDDDDDNDDNDGYTYLWSPTTGLSSSTSSHPTANPSVTTTYTLTKTANGSGCSATDNVTVTVNTTAPTANAGNDFTKTCGINTNGATIGAAAITGHTYSWSPSTGLSSSTAANPTANPSVTTTYTLTVRNTATGCTASDLVTVTVDLSLPTVSVTPASRCGAGTVSLSATASQGNINWYSSATGGTILYTGNTFTTPSLSSSTTYYVSALSGSCTSATRTAITATIVANPTVSASTPASRCGAGTVSLVATPSGGSINWYNTSSGGTSLSTGNSFITPSLSSTTTYYVDATNNGCTTPTRTSVTATINEIPVITAVPASRCGTGTVVLSASTSTGSISWFSAATAGANVANGLTYTTPSLSSSVTYYLSATSNGCTVSNRTPITATINTIPTVSNPLAASLCGPGTLTLGATASTGTINWYTSSTAGTLAGSGASFNTPSLSTTTTYFAEAIANGCSSASRTAVIATITPIPSISSTTAGSRCGTGTVALGAVASSGTISWFANETGGSALASSGSFTSPSISATTTYYVSASSAGCTSTSRTAVIATVNAIPTISTTTPANRCGAGTLTLNASASAGTINWFTAATGGASIATGSTYTTASLSSSTNYYVSASENGCTSASRTLITATINTIPTVTSSTGASRCGEGTVTLNAISGSNTLNWYESATGGSSIYTGASFITPTISQTSTFYVDATAANGCTSSNRTSVTATINPVPTITSITSAERCGNGAVTLSATASAGSVKWYSANSAGALVSSATSFTTPSLTSTTNYYVEAMLGTCSSSPRTVVIATINANPTVSDQSTSAATYIQNALSSALSVSALPGSGNVSSYQWFINTVANTTSGTAIEGADSLGYFPSTSDAGTNYYYCLITNSNGCSVKSAISGAILVHPRPTITSVIPTLPLVSDQSNNTGYRGQRITLNGSNFSSNATVRFNGIAATSVVFVNANQLTAVVNNTGVNTDDVVTVTNPTTTASASAPFSYIGYYTNSTGDWSLTSSWLGASLPLVGSDATIAHATTCNTNIVPVFNKVSIRPLASLTLGTALSALKSNTVVVNGTLSFTLTGSLTISNTFNFGMDGTFNPGAGRVIFNNEGDQQLFTGKSSLTFNAVTISGAGTKTLGNLSSIQVKNLHLDEGATFNPGILQDVEITGDVELNGNMDPGNSKFRFTGSSNQSISVSGAGTAWFSDLHVNKPSGKILLNSNVQVRDTLKMISGHIDTQSNTLEIGLNTTRTGSIEYTAGYISGKLRRWYAASSNSGNLSGLFPMGELLNNTWKSRHVLLEYNEAPSNGGHLTVEFKNIPMINGALGTQDFISQSNSGNAGFTITNFSDDGYWKIDNQENTLTDGKYTIALTGEGFLSLNNSLTQMTMVKRVNGGNWFCPGRHLSTLGDLNSPTLRRSNVSGFSNFGFAGGASNALPISLINFNAECIDEVVYLKWSTASESNNKEFHIEESDDAATWKVVKVIDGAGNSNVTLNYEEKLSSNFPDGSYFRMSQVDYNGDSESFDPVFVYCEKKLKSEVKIYPNPATEFVNVEISSPDEMDVQLTLFSSAGQILLIQKVQLETGSNSVRLDITSLPPGAYHLNLSNDRKLEITGSRSIIKR